MMRIHSLLLLAAASAIVPTTHVLAGSAPYTGNKPAAPAQPAQSAEQTYSYHCWARTRDNTEYATAVIAEPTPHDTQFIGKATEAWKQHLSQDLGLSKFQARCGETPTSMVSTWAPDSPGTKRVDWRYQ